MGLFYNISRLALSNDRMDRYRKYSEDPTDDFIYLFYRGGAGGSAAAGVFLARLVVLSSPSSERIYRF